MGGSARCLLRRTLAWWPIALACAACGAEEDDAAEGVIGAPGVTVTGVAIYQGPEHVLAAGHVEVASDVPIIAGRDALVRVFYETDAAYDGGPVTATLSLTSGDIRVETALFRESHPLQLASTVTFDVPGESIDADTVYAVSITRTGRLDADNPSARWPENGTAPLVDVHVTPHRLRIMLVPFRYDADGSQRLPDVSEAQLARFRRAMYALYPVTEVDIEVHEVVPLATPLAMANDWTTWLDGLVDLRAAESPDPDVYYYGVAVPTESLVSYTGFPDGLAATVDTPGDPALRAAVGLGYSQDELAYLMAHEIGHVHGRRHTLCGGAAGPDPNYPHAGGDIGVPVFDLVTRQLYAPGFASDIMGYCYPRTSSDYGYSIFDDTIHIAQGMVARVSGPMERHVRASIHPDGTIHPLSAIERGPIAASSIAGIWGGVEVPVVLVLEDGERVPVTGRFSRFDHVPGGIVEVREPPEANVRSLEVAAIPQ